MNHERHFGVELLRPQWRAPSKDKEAGLEARGPMTLDRNRP